MASLLGKWCSRLVFRIPTPAAMSFSDVPANPCSAKQCCAASRIASRVERPPSDSVMLGGYRCGPAIGWVGMTAPDLEQRAINVIRGLAMDAPHAARSGHQGTAMALAPLAHVLWTRILRYDASAPGWPDRDRFVLSAGHASILLYSLLHLTGYDVSLDDLRDF